jgi:hypothetical protein
MATITSAASGNWSNTATWVGGVVPTSGDIIVLNHGITLNVDINGITINSYNASGKLLINNTSRNIYDITINVTIASTEIILITNTSTLNIVNITALLNYNGGSVTGLIRSISPVTVNINATCVTSVTSFNYLMQIEGAGTIATFNGAFTKAGTGGGVIFYTWASGCVINLNGVLLSNSSFLSSSNNNTVALWPLMLNVSGVSTYNNPIGFSLFGINIVSSGIHKSLQGAPIFMQPFSSASTFKKLSGASLQIEILDTTNTPSSLYTADLLTGYPAEADVEDGVIYGPSNEFEGTLQPVVINTAQLATDLLTEMNTSNLTIAQGLRDGMGASAAAIAAVGSINVIP